MTMHSDHHDSSFINSVAGQMALLTAALVGVTVLSWFFVF